MNYFVIHFRHGLLELGGDIKQNTDQKHTSSQEMQSVNNDHHDRVINRNHLNDTRFLANNDTVKTLTRHQVDAYLAQLSEHIHLVGNIIKPRPINIYWIKTGSFHTNTNIFSNTVLSSKFEWAYTKHPYVVYKNVIIRRNHS